MIPSIKTATILKFIYVLTFASVLVLDASAQGVSKPGKWATVEADNGAVYKIDMVHTWHGNDSLGNVIADAFVWRAEDSLHYFGEFIFDCNHHRYMVVSEGNGEYQYAPPRSVTGRILTLACGSSQKR